MNISKKQSDWKGIVKELSSIADQKNITQEELAHKAGMIQSAISRVFKTTHIPNLNTVVLIADALDADIVVVKRTL